VFIDRIDGFNGPVRIDIANLPTGFYATSPLVVEAGQRLAQGVIFAHPDAPAPSEAAAAGVTITATATVGATPQLAGRELSQPVKGLGKLKLGPKPKIVVHLAPVDEPPRVPGGDGRTLTFPQPAEVALPAGGSTTFRLTAERHGFDGIINFDVDNLPHGVIISNIGLNGIQLLEGQTERTLFLAAEPWVAEQTRTFELFAKEDGVQVALPLALRVRRATPGEQAAAMSNQ